MSRPAERVRLPFALGFLNVGLHAGFRQHSAKVSVCDGREKIGRGVEKTLAWVLGSL